MNNSKQTKGQGGRNLNFLFIIGLILSILLIVFAIANQEMQEINFLFFRLKIQLALLIFLCISIGALIALLFSVPGWFRSRKTKSRLEKELKDLRKNYEDLAKINTPSKS